MHWNVSEVRIMHLDLVKTHICNIPSTMLQIAPRVRSSHASVFNAADGASFLYRLKMEGKQCLLIIRVW